MNNSLIVGVREIEASGKRNAKNMKIFLPQQVREKYWRRANSIISNSKNPQNSGVHTPN